MEENLMADPIDYIGLFGEDFLAILESLEELTPELEEMLLATLDDMVFDVEVFGNHIEKQVTKLTNAGLNMSAIEETLNQDMLTGGRIFGELRNTIKDSIVDGVNQSSRFGQYSGYDLTLGTFTWITVSGRVCDDCASREGMKGTFADFESIGLPGAGNTICKSYCYCVLDPTGELSTRTTIPGIREKGA